MTGQAVIYIGTHSLELYRGADLAIGYTVAAQDVRGGQGSKGAVFSERIRVPWDGVNAGAVNYITMVTKKLSDDDLGEFDFKIELDGNFFAKGRCRVAAVGRDLNPAYIELVLLSGNLDWVGILEGRAMRDLPLGSHSFTKATVESTWSGTYAQNNGTRYFPVNYGEWLATTYVGIEDLRPHISYRHMLETAFRQAGYQFDSSFMGSDFLSRLYWLYRAGAWELTNAQLALMPVEADDDTVDDTSGELDFVIPFRNEVTDPGGNFTDPEYIAQQPGRNEFIFDFEVNHDDGGDEFVDYQIMYDDGGGAVAVAQVNIGTHSYQFYQLSVVLNVNTGDKVYLRLFDNQAQGTHSSAIRNRTFQVIPDSEVAENATVFPALTLPADRSQLWLVQQVSRLFNLEWWTDVVRRRVYVEPWGDFPLPKDVALDWSAKVDRSQEIVDETIDSELRREQLYRYADDPNDAGVASLLNEGDLPLHSRLVELGSRFQPGRDEQTVELGPTAMKQEILAAVDTGIYMPTLWGEGGDLNSLQYPAQSFEFLPRIVYWEGLIEKQWRWYENSNVENNFPLARSFQFEGTDPTLTSLSWGDVPSDTVKLIGNQDGVDFGLVDRYYRPLHELLMQGRLRTCFMDLTRTDVQVMDLRRLVKIVDEDGQRYWRIHKVERFEPLMRQSTRTELVPYFYSEPSAIPPEPDGYELDGEFFLNAFDVTTDPDEVPGDLSEYHWYIDLASAPAGFWTKTRSDLGDVWAGTTDGTKRFPVYIHAYDKGAETGYLTVYWNEITFSGVNPNTVRIYYNNAAVAPLATNAPFGRDDTFTGFAAIWDFEQDPTGTAPQLTDLTGNSHDGTAFNTWTGGRVTGKVGSSWDFIAASSRYVQADRLDLIQQNLTIGSWLKTSATNRPGMFGAPRSAGNNRYAIGQGNDGATQNLNYMFHTTNGGSVVRAPINNGAWRHVVMTAERGGDQTDYLDGAINGVPTSGVANYNISGLDNPLWTLGAHLDAAGTTPVSGRYYTGEQDIQWATFSVLSADRIATIYANQNAPNTFHTIGMEI